jgi:hypothetical protein
MRDLPRHVHAPRLDAPRGRQGEDGLVVPAVAKRHAVRLEACGHPNHLVAHAHTKHGPVPHVERATEHARGGRAVRRVTRAVAEHEAVVRGADSVEVGVPGEHGARRAAAHKRAEDVRLGAEVEHRDAHVAGRVERVLRARRRLRDERLPRRVPVCVRRGRRGRRVGPHRHPAQRRPLVPQDARDGTRVDVGEPRDVVPQAPVVERLDGRVVRVLFGEVGDNDRGRLDARGLEHDTDVCGGDWCGVVRHAVVPDHGRGEDENLAAIRGVGHTFRICGHALVGVP